MSLLLLEALAALLLLLLMVWWTMFSGRKNGELPTRPATPGADTAAASSPLETPPLDDPGIASHGERDGKK